MGASGLGSTVTDTGSGGGGGGDDFSLVLQSLAKPGSIVKKGDVVAEFDRQYMLLRLDDYRASVTQAEATFNSLKSNLAAAWKAHQQQVDAAKGQLEKARLDMKTIPVLSAIDAERTKLALESADAQYKQLVSEAKLLQASQQAQIRNAELELEQARIELRRAETNAAKLVVKAPIDGLTVIQNIFRGSDFTPVQAGDQLRPGQFFMQIVDPKSMVVDGMVNQVDAERLRIGQRARVRFDAYPDLVLPAHVQSVGGIAKSGGARESYVKELPVRLKLENLDPRVIPDLTVSANVILETEQQAVVAPRAGVFRDAGSSPPYVFVRRPGGWARQEIELGTVNFIEAAVRSGLKAGDVIALDRPPQSGGMPAARN